MGSSGTHEHQPQLYIKITCRTNKILMLELYPRPINQNLWRWDPGINSFKNSQASLVFSLG